LNIIEKMNKKYGTDPLVKHYLSSNKQHINNCTYYKTKLSNYEGISFILLPYILEDGELVWTKDKLTFENIKQLHNFCESLNIENVQLVTE